jgi:hypothetical protein
MKISFLYGVRIDCLISMTIKHGGVSWKRIPSYFLHLIYGCYTVIISIPDLFWRDKGMPEDITFILGHYRSGTTHLVNLMNREGHFVTPNSYQCLFPHSFLTTESVFSPLLNLVAPKTRPMDNMEMTMQSPQEDEIAMAAMGAPTPYLSVHFPKNAEYFRNLISMKDASSDDLLKWQSTHKSFMKKLAKRYGKERPLLLKSPVNTARIPLLLKMYPNAKFVHVHRDPYKTIRSSIHLYSVWYEMDHFQSIIEMKKNLNSNVLDVYEIIQKGWAAENHLIPEKQKVSISFDELQKRPVDTLAKVYSHFDLQMKNQKVVEYLETIKHYKKNDYSELSDEMVAEINERFEGVFERFGYAKTNVEVSPN